MPSVYDELASNENLSLYFDFVDRTNDLYNQAILDGLISNNLDAVNSFLQNSSRSFLAPTNAAMFALASELGYTGHSPKDAVDAIVNYLLTQSTSVPVFGLTTFIVGHAGFPAVDLVDWNSVFFPNYTANGTTISDLDPDSIDAEVLIADVPVTNGTLQVIDSVTFLRDYAFNDLPVTVNATSGNDNQNGTTGVDIVDLLAGDDVYSAGDGDDIILAGDGNDSVRGGNDNDQVRGGAGNDTLRGDRGDDTLLGNSGDDVLSGNKGNDELRGGSGDDLVKGGEGDDLVSGGDGNDIVHGNKGNDILLGLGGDDVLIDAQGSSILIGGTGDDTLKGGSEADTFIFREGSGADFIIDFGNGADVIDLVDFGLTGLGDLTLTQQGTNTLVALSSGESILLNKTLIADLGAADFLF